MIVRGISSWKKEIQKYLLLVDVGLRSFISFECPTRCKHQDTSWRSRLFQHRQHAMAVSSNVTRLCCWRSASECPVAICTSWAYIYVLSYHNNCHPAGEGRCGQYFLCLLIACRLQSNFLSISASPELWASTHQDAWSTAQSQFLWLVL